MVSAAPAASRPAVLECTRQLAQAMREFEAVLTSSATRTDWPSLRNDWIPVFEKADTASELATQLLKLEQAMKWEAVAPQWRDRRPAWIAEVQSAKEPGVIGARLLELERVTSWASVNENWASQRSAWIARKCVSSGRGAVRSNTRICEKVPAAPSIDAAYTHHLLDWHYFAVRACAFSRPNFRVVSLALIRRGHDPCTDASAQSLCENDISEHGSLRSIRATALRIPASGCER